MDFSKSFVKFIYKKDIGHGRAYYNNTKDVKLYVFYKLIEMGHDIDYGGEPSGEYTVLPLSVCKNCKYAIGITSQYIQNYRMLEVSCNGFRFINWSSFSSVPPLWKYP